MDDMGLTADLTVAELLARWPQTAQVFLRYRMACIGCTMAPFDTLADVTTAYDLRLDLFLSELRRTIAETGPPGAGPEEGWL
ncbi:MAG TPA: DUF1858 domain-containing protein [Caldilineae bacterium]|jgi:hybrid cluster-associated redox disulfide protein|nr:DUF1858 domain-containing protein [Caldilineae bacterium]